MERRFKLQTLLDKNAVLACMVYVDLNPIRTKMKAKPKISKHSNIKKRVQTVKIKNINSPNLCHLSATTAKI
jgi:hypothetical protein